MFLLCQLRIGCSPPPLLQLPPCSFVSLLRFGTSPLLLLLLLLCHSSILLLLFYYSTIAIAIITPTTSTYLVFCLISLVNFAVPCCFPPIISPAHLHPRYALQWFRHYLQGNTRIPCPKSRFIIDNLLFPSSSVPLVLLETPRFLLRHRPPPSSATSPPLSSLSLAASLALYTISSASIVCAGIPWRPLVRSLEWPVDSPFSRATSFNYRSP